MAGHHGDGAEPGDQASVKPRAGLAGFAFGPKPHQPPGDQRRKRQPQAEVDQKQDLQHRAGWGIGGQAGEHRIGRRTGSHRQSRDAKRQA